MELNMTEKLNITQELSSAERSVLRRAEMAMGVSGHWAWCLVPAIILAYTAYSESGARLSDLSAAIIFLFGAWAWYERRVFGRLIVRMQKEIDTLKERTGEKP
jgi:hypothetical protein